MQFSLSLCNYHTSIKSPPGHTSKSHPGDPRAPERSPYARQPQQSRRQMVPIGPMPHARPEETTPETKEISRNRLSQRLPPISVGAVLIPTGHSQRPMVVSQGGLVGVAPGVPRDPLPTAHE